jgi:hypothetical protein
MADLHKLQFTVSHALGFSVSTSRLIATDLNTENGTSNHDEDFLPFLVQSPWNLGTHLKLSLGQSQSESESHCDWRSVSLSWCRAPSGAHDQILITVWQLLSCPWEGARSDERTGLSFVSQSAVLGQLSVCTISIFYMCHLLLNTYTICTKPLSVRAQYSRLCPISGSFPITAV